MSTEVELVRNGVSYVDGAIVTASGRQFWPLDPRESDIDIEDVAHGLAMLCSDTHVREHYSLAQHAVHVSELVEADPKAASKKYLALAGLLDNAPLAYLGVVPKPLRAHLLRYSVWESRLRTMINAKYIIGVPGDPEFRYDVRDYRVANADRKMEEAELRDLEMANPPGEEPSDVKRVTPWSVWAGETLYMRRFHELTGQ